MFCLFDTSYISSQLDRRLLIRLFAAREHQIALRILDCACRDSLRERTKSVCSARGDTFWVT
jgi:hypothetical protein